MSGLGLSYALGLGLGSEGGGSSPPAAWTPALTTTLAWYDASDAATITSASNLVSAWNDKSGANKHLTQATAADQPQYGSRQINSLDVVDFTSNDFMDSASLVMPPDCDILFVAQVDTVDHGSDALLSYRSNWTRDWQFDAAHGSQFRGRWLPQTNQSYGTATPWSQGDLKGSTHLFGQTFDNSASLMTGRLNGAAVTSLTGNYSLATNTPGSFRLFGNRGANQFPLGAFAELIFVPKQTTLGLQKLEGYLAHKWGLTASLPVSHPYKSSMPVAPTVANFDYLALSSLGSDENELLKFEFEFDQEVPAGNQIVLELSHSDAQLGTTVLGWNLETITDVTTTFALSATSLGNNKWGMTAISPIPAGKRIGGIIDCTRTSYSQVGWTPFTVDVSMTGSPIAVPSTTGPHSPGGTPTQTATLDTVANIIATNASVGDWYLATDDLYKWYVFDGQKWLTYDPWDRVAVPTDLAITRIGRTDMDVSWTGEPYLHYVFAWGLTDETNASGGPAANTSGGGNMVTGHWTNWDHDELTYQGDHTKTITGLTPGTLYYAQLYVMPRHMVAGDVPVQSAMIQGTTSA